MATKKASPEALEVLKNCTVKGNVVTLPAGQLDRKVYEDVKKQLELIGGKWKGGKTQGFVFEGCEQSYIEDLLNDQAEGDGRDLKKENQFFATPVGLAREMAIRACTNIDVTSETLFLEPSAGDGALIKALIEVYPDIVVVDCFEIMEINRKKLGKIAEANLVGEDFLASVQNDSLNMIGRYDVIIANPPFSGNQDIDHIRAMYDCLKPGGRLITVASPSWTFGSQKKQIEFRKWLEELGAETENLPAQLFKDSGTNIATVLIEINKVANEIILTDDDFELRKPEASNVVPIALGDIVADPNQPRKYFSEQELEELATSIKKHGILQAITLRPATPGKYMVVFGERRYRAAQKAGLELIPACIRELTDQEALELQIIENLQRKDVHPLEEGESFKILASQIGKQKHDANPIKEIASRIGKSEGYVRGRLKITELHPEFKEMYEQDRMTMQQALAICRLPLNGQKHLLKHNMISGWQKRTDFTLGNITFLLEQAQNDLDRATFKTEDPNLIPDAGACNACPFNTANHLVLFPKEEGKRICSNSVCFSNKTVASYKQTMEDVVKRTDLVYIANWGYGKEYDAKIQAAKEMGITEILGRNKWTEPHELDTPDWNKYLEEEKNWDDDDDDAEESEQSLRESYNELVKEYEEEVADFEQAKREGRVVKAFVIAGNNEGKIIDIILDPAQAAAVLTTMNSDDPEFKKSQLEQQIRQIEFQMKEGRGKDQVDVCRKIAELMQDDEAYITDAPLSKNEQGALCMAMFEEVSYYTTEGKFLLDQLQVKTNYEASQLFAELPQNLLNYLSRAFFMAKLQENLGDSSATDGAMYWMRKIATEYKKDEVTAFELEQEEKCIQREEKLQSRLDALKAELESGVAPEPPQKKKRTKATA